MHNTSGMRAISEFLRLVQEWREMKTADIVRRGNLGEQFDFAEAEEAIEGLKRLGEEVGSYDLSRVPPGYLDKLTNRLVDAKNRTDRMRQFNPQMEGAIAQRQALIRELVEQWENLMREAAPVLAAKALWTRSLVEDTFKQVQTQIDEELKQVEALSSKAKLAMKGIEDAAAQAGVSSEAIHFKEEADRHWWAAFWWLAGTLAITAAIVGCLAYAYLHPMSVQPGDNWVVVQRLVAKLVILSFASGLAVFTGRNYSTSRHNYVVNQHRATALSTFQAFIAGTADAETKNAILLQAARSVFSAQHSGYLRKEGDLQTGGPILEIIRSMATKQG